MGMLNRSAHNVQGMAALSARYLPLFDATGQSSRPKDGSHRHKAVIHSVR